MKRLHHLANLIVMLLAAGACARARVAPAHRPVGVTPTVPPGPFLNDQNIRTAVKSRLDHDPGVNSRNMRVSVSQGIVELTGKVSDLLTQRRAVRVAEAVKGVRAVSERLELSIEPRTDRDLEEDVEKTLAASPPTNHYDVKVTVTEGNVMLQGTVPSHQARQLCDWLAEGVRGTRTVDNRLQVRSSGTRPDDAIERDVLSRLRWDVLVNSAHIHASVADGHVALRGEVASVAERRRAGTDAWVEGVKDIDDSQLRVAAWRPDLLRHDLFVQSDEAIAKAVRDAIAYDPRISAADVNADVHAGYVVLRGSVGNPLARSVAEELARNTVGVLFVKNELEVRPVEPLPDPELETRIRQAISRNPYTRGLAILVKVVAGKVLLGGEVPSAFQRAHATTLAASIEGVRDVDNEISVLNPKSGYVYHSFFYPYGPYADGWYAMPAQPIGPDSRIAEAVRTHLEWNPLVDSKSIDVRVESAKATLTGHVASSRERIAAAESAYEGGALVVDNQLQVSDAPKPQ